MNYIAQIVIEAPKEAIDPVLLMKYTIGWICVGVFLVTAIAACIALFRPIIVPDARIRSWLYKFLLGQTVVICIAVFSGLLDPKPLKTEAREAIRRANNDAIDIARAASDLNVSENSPEERPPPPSGDSGINNF